jgi:hypothetical protein
MLNGMAISCRLYEPQQDMLLPASLQDWLPKGHLAYFISDTVDALELKAFYARYACGSARNQPFHPAMMVKVLVYGYTTGVFSSRKIERPLHEDLAFQMLAQATSPSTARSATSAPCTSRHRLTRYSTARSHRRGRGRRARTGHSRANRAARGPPEGHRRGPRAPGAAPARCRHRARP